MMKQAQKLQKEMLQTKSEIDNKTFEITKSFMSLKMKGNKTIEEVKINLEQCEKEDIEMVYDLTLPCNREDCEKKVTYLREKYGFTKFTGDNVEYHSSGCVTFPVLGTKANIEDKVAFDPDRKKRRAFYPEVKELFSEYNVFVGGSSSFDMSPRPYNKYYALDKYCEENGFLHSEAVFVGDDWGEGGNDESVYLSDFNFITIDNYLDFPERIKILL